MVERTSDSSVPAVSDPRMARGKRFRSKEELDAQVISDLAIPAHLKSMLDHLPNIEALGAKQYVEEFVQKAAAQKDPVEQLLLQQLLMLHHRIARLHDEASQAKTLEGIKIVNGAAARLAGEFRRLTLCLRTYRSPTVTKSATFIKMQAVAEHQEVRYIDTSTVEDSDQRIVLAHRGEVEEQTGQIRQGGRNDDAEDQVTRPGSGRFKAAAVDR